MDISVDITASLCEGIVITDWALLCAEAEMQTSYLLRCPDAGDALACKPARRAGWCIFTTVPVWGHYAKNTASDLLCRCYRSCLEIAAAKQVKSIAFPLLGCETGGFPKERAVKLAVLAVREYAHAQPGTSIEQVVFTVSDPVIRAMLEDEIIFSRSCLQLSHIASDLHAHIVWGVDDGPVDEQMSQDMLRLCYEQGIRCIFATSHGNAYTFSQQEYDANLLRLVTYAEKNWPDLKICSGTEIHVRPGEEPAVIEALKNKRLHYLGHSRKALIELSVHGTMEENHQIVRNFLQAGQQIVVAHAERYHHFCQDMGKVEALVAMGCEIQVNAYSLSEENGSHVRNRAQELAQRRLIHYLGTDTHRTNHRPPSMQRGLQWLYAHADAGWVEQISYKNAQYLSVTEARTMNDWYTTNDARSEVPEGTAYDVNRFLKAQEFSYDIALREIRRGRKESHWIWYIFPQLADLGRSGTAKEYGIRNLEHARAYLREPVLRKRLLEISQALLEQAGNIRSILPHPDHLKVRSCMTLFKEADPSITVFQQVLDKFYDGKPDQRTLDILYPEKQIIAPVEPKPSREQMAHVFAHTLEMIRQSDRLQHSIRQSIAAEKLYGENDRIVLPANPGYAMQISVSTSRSFQAAQLHKRNAPSKRVAVLNFASATTPGGGVISGARAQEESLCRCSTLYPCLDTPYLKENYYNYHRSRYSNLYTDACIYTPDVVVFKKDINIPEAAPEEDWYQVDVITCAAPNLRHAAGSLTTEEQYRIHCSRARKILSAAAANGAERLVLGAFGCGAFCNDPSSVAMAYKDTLRIFEGYFECVEFAVFTAGGESQNYIAFRDVFHS